MGRSRAGNMPELPEVETTVRGLAPFREGQRLIAVTTFRPDLRRPFPADLAQRLTGATVTTLSRRAKYGIVSTDRDDHMRSEEHTSELQSLMRISYAVFCLKKKKRIQTKSTNVSTKKIKRRRLRRKH